MPHLLARVNYPIYGCKTITDRHIMVCGGGGSSKTGIANTAEIYELIYDPSTNCCRAQLITRYDTETRAIMNFCIINNEPYNYQLLTGGSFDGMCNVFTVKMEKRRSMTLGKKNEEKTLLRRRRTQSINEPEIRTNDENRFVFTIEPQKMFKTDFSQNDPFQKQIRFNGEFFVTGGSDGHLRVWKYPQMSLYNEIHAHSNEIDDLDLSLNEIVSISKYECFIWDLKSGKMLNQLKFPDFIFRGSRFITNDNAKKLITIMNGKKGHPKGNTLICKWSNYEIEKCVKAGDDPLSTMALSDDGRFIGIGTSMGSVDVYITFSLMRLYHMTSVHKIFVTGIEFLKSSCDTQQLIGGHETALVSVSVDNHIVVHEIPKLTTIGFAGTLTFFTVFMFFVYSTMNFMGL